MIEILDTKGKFYVARISYSYRTEFGNYFISSWLELRMRRRILPDITIKTTEDKYNNITHLKSLLKRLAK